MRRAAEKKEKRNNGWMFRTVMVVGTVVMYLVIAFDMFRTKANESHAVVSSSNQVSSILKQGESDLPLSETITLDGTASAMQHGIEVSFANDNQITTINPYVGPQTISPEELKTVVGEQERVDAIQKAFLRLPAPELERLQVNVDKPVQAGTPEAAKLFDAWKQRQAELREAMKTMLQPAEHMANLTKALNGTAPGEDGQTVPLSADEKVYLLKQLEGLLDDVDNARDFHTIGAWPTLLSFLQPANPAQVRAAAAWAVGTAVKNTYDYQLWTLEAHPSGNVAEGEGEDKQQGQTGVELLLALLDPALVAEEGYEMTKRALYALSAAMRGNMDVQDAIRRYKAGAQGEEVLYVERLLHIARSHSDRAAPVPPADVVRKVWASAADLLEERAFIRRELAATVEAQLAEQKSQENTTSSGLDSSEGVLRPVDLAVRTLRAAPHLGDALVSERWMAAAVRSGAALTKSLLEPEGEAAAADYVAQHAALRSVLAFCKEVVTDSPALYGTGEAPWQRGLQLLVRAVTTDFERESGTYDALLTAGDELAAVLGLLDQGTNTAVF